MATSHETESQQQPLLGERRDVSSSSTPSRHSTLPRFFHPRMFYPAREQHRSLIAYWRSYTRGFLTSKWGHYLVLLLVSMDVACIFSDFMIELHVCELKQRRSRVDPRWETTRNAFDIISLTFSSLFVVELLLSIVSFGISYFSSKFHIFDSVVILAAFVIDVTLHGTDEELGSLVVVFRLWRVFKIIEELSSAGQDSLEKYEDEIQQLREDNRNLRRRLNATSDSRNSAGDGSDEDYDEGNAS